MTYLNEVIWITGCFLISAYLLLFLPMHRYREAWVVFLFNQTLTWGIGVVIFSAGRISSPVRPFPNATNQYVLDGYLFYPALSVLSYFLGERCRSRMEVHLLTLSTAALITAWDYTETRFTRLKEYKGGITSLYVFLIAAAALYLTRWFALRFFQDLHKENSRRED
ncbi:CBO0543 family protein [Gorillibacterium sp. sgz5001074]|uniref:CBO0543 family protein n=1 Tax=Gorillibacterium sp. sgz5001074 TaxID=3446695 RepID=UPI003F682099